MIVGFIPARGGSKRLPGKNIRPFAGKPLIAHTIEQARRSRRLDRCVVSTDSEQIGNVAKEYGAEVVWRPAELATDTATTASAAHHLIHQIGGDRVRALVTLQPNCPLRPAGLIDQAIELFDRKRADSVVGVTRTQHKEGTVQDGCFVPEYRPGTRCQDMPARYFENGLIYVSQGARLLETGDMWGTRKVPLIIDAVYALGDIDTELDFEIAEYLFCSHRQLFLNAAGVTGATP